MYSIHSTAPTRVDIAGGTLDLWPLAHLLRSKATVNFGISLFARCELKPSTDKVFHLRSLDQKIQADLTFSSLGHAGKLPLVELLVKELWSEDLPPLDIQTSAESPAGAGLGGSSSMDVAVANALWRARQIYEDKPELADHQKVAILKNLEVQLIKAPTGSQDFWGALRGNINIINYPAVGEFVETLKGDRITELGESLLLCYTGVSRASAANNWQIFKGVFEGNQEMLLKLAAMGEYASHAAHAIKRSDVPNLLHWSQKEWEVRKSLWRDIETPETQSLDRAAKDAGAFFTRLCGAGGGGVMAIFAERKFHDDIRTRCKNLGGTILDAKIVATGAQVTMQGSNS